MWKRNGDLVSQLRRGFLFLALGASLLLVGVLAYQAQDAARSHRRTAESVLEGYALLAAREFIRRVDSEVGYYGVFFALQPLNSPLLPDPDSLDPKQRGRDLVQAYFRWPDNAPHPTWKSGAKEDFRPPDLESLRQHARNFDPDWTYSLFWGPGQEDPLIFYRVQGKGDERRLEGLAANLEALNARFQKILNGSPLLPLSVGGRTTDNSLFAVTIAGDQGRILFRHHPPNASYVQVRERFRQGWSDLRLIIEIDPDSTSHLIIGGLPGSRMPLLLGLLVLNSGLILAALFQLRRDRAFADRQTAFIAAVSHELRTPLAQIRMFADTLLLGRVRSPQERRRSLEILSAETRRLSHFLENVIQFSRSLRQSARLQIKPIDPVPVIENLLEHFRPLAESSGTSVRLLVSGPAERIEVDPDAFRRILLNLLDNAAKYGPPGQEVVISLEQGPDRATRISIEDQGVGVPESQRKKIWQPFQRLEQRGTAHVAGTGIGLSVVRELVETQGGKVWVENGSTNGARFVVEFPAVPGQNPAYSGESQENVR